MTESGRYSHILCMVALLQVRTPFHQPPEVLCRNWRCEFLRCRRSQLRQRIKRSIAHVQFRQPRIVPHDPFRPSRLTIVANLYENAQIGQVAKRLQCDRQLPRVLEVLGTFFDGEIHQRIGKRGDGLKFSGTRNTAKVFSNGAPLSYSREHICSVVFVAVGEVQGAQFIPVALAV